MLLEKLIEADRAKGNDDPRIEVGEMLRDYVAKHRPKLDAKEKTTSPGLGKAAVAGQGAAGAAKSLATEGDIFGAMGKIGKTAVALALSVKGMGMVNALIKSQGKDKEQDNNVDLTAQLQALQSMAPQPAPEQPAPTQQGPTHGQRR